MSNWMDELVDFMTTPEGKVFLHKVVDMLSSKGVIEETLSKPYTVLGLDPSCTDEKIREHWKSFSALPDSPARRSAHAAYLLICLWRGIEP